MDESESSAAELEISEVNPAAHRRPGGVWCEDILPVLEWEAAEHRVVLPEDLQRGLGFPVPVLRWTQAKRDRVTAEHAQSLEQQIHENPTRHLANWLHAGLEPGKSHVWRVFFRVGYRWCVAVIGQDRNDSFNVVTIHSPSDSNYLPNMISKGDYMVRGAESS